MKLVVCIVGDVLTMHGAMVLWLLEGIPANMAVYLAAIPIARQLNVWLQPFTLNLLVTDFLVGGLN